MESPSARQATWPGVPGTPGACHICLYSSLVQAPSSCSTQRTPRCTVPGRMPLAIFSAPARLSQNTSSVMAAHPFFTV